MRAARRQARLLAGGEKLGAYVQHGHSLLLGQVEQVGPQPAVFAHPASPTAARLLGIRNLHEAERIAGAPDLFAALEAPA